MCACALCRYLVKSKEAAPNTERGTLITYEWGEAAHSEFGGGALEGIVTQVSSDAGHALCFWQHFLQ
jgi:hypothetical protein